MTIDKKLAILDDFPAISTEQWEAVIQGDLKGADYNKKLVWMTDEKLAIRPYYREEALTTISSQLSPIPGQFPFLRGTKAHNHWTIRQGIDGPSLKDANAAAREALARGADAVSFYGAELGGADPQSADEAKALLAGIDAPVSFRAQTKAGRVLAVLIEAAGRGDVSLSKISVDFDPLHDLLLTGGSAQSGAELFAGAAALLRATAKFQGMRPLAVRAGQIAEAGGTAVHELADAIAAGTEYLAALTAEGLGVDEVAGAIHFDMAVSTNYFFEIAKLRALRFLWAQVVDQFHPASRESAKALVTATASRWDATVYDRHMNLLRGTTKTMSAAIGGADVIETLPFDTALDAADDFSRHLARNTQIVLKKESYFDRAVDPGAGSYYLETLTDSLAREAWGLFQKIEAHGGYLKAIEGGLIQAEVEAARAKKDKGISGRFRNILGTNQFPNGKEKVLADVQRKTPAPPVPGKYAIQVTPLPPYRGADGYEALRLRTERYVAAGNKNPRFVLLEYGDLKMRKARVGFSMNFIACAGFDLATKFTENTPEAAAKTAAEAHADVIVLCSSDDEYLPMAKPLIELLKGTTPVIVAGSPATMDQLKADGVADFIHIRSNALEVLSAWQTKLGVRE